MAQVEWGKVLNADAEGEIYNEKDLDKNTESKGGTKNLRWKIRT